MPAETLYPSGYGIRLVTMDELRARYEPHMHPEAARRGFNFIYHQGGKFGIGSGFRTTQPVGPTFAPDGQSFHQAQRFPSGMFYIAWDMVVVNPGYRHRTPRWDEVPMQDSHNALFVYGVHHNVGKPGSKGNESWHEQPVPIDGWGTWVNQGRPDLQYNYPIQIFDPRPQPPQPPVPPTQPPTKRVIVEFTSRNLFKGSIGNDVKFYQGLLNDLSGRQLLIDGFYGPRTEEAVRDWQIHFGLTVDGVLGPKTQRSIIEIALIKG